MLKIVAQADGAFLLERGLTFRQGRTHLEKQMGTILSAVETDHPGFFSRLLRQLRSEWQSLDADIAALDKELGTIAARDASCRRLMKIPGVGVLVATATVAAVGRGAAFRRGRGFASWLGLVPRQHSTGGKPKLLGISKRGNPYLRRLYIHGARSVFMHARRERQRWGEWLSQLETRTHANVAVVALANKLARIAWAVLASETPYDPVVAAS